MKSIVVSVRRILTNRVGHEVDNVDDNEKDGPESGITVFPKVLSRKNQKEISL